ncbi:hypothetical protein DPEC_G00364770 [Dallia pectoralis]|nr:hypothetical protein DPEC_G00364770 [Dallia pectoralis]
MAPAVGSRHCRAAAWAREQPNAQPVAILSALQEPTSCGARDQPRSAVVGVKHIFTALMSVVVHGLPSSCISKPLITRQWQSSCPLSLLSSVDNILRSSATNSPGRRHWARDT